MSTLFLKMKLKSLAAEAKIIRQQERKMRGAIWGPRAESLHNHRINVVRREARHTHLAYAYLRGTPYREVEQTAKVEFSLSKVVSMLKRYGPVSNNVEKDVQHWLDGSPVELRKSA